MRFESFAVLRALNRCEIEKGRIRFLGLAHFRKLSEYADDLRSQRITAEMPSHDLLLIDRQAYPPSSFVAAGEPQFP